MKNRKRFGVIALSIAALIAMVVISQKHKYAERTLAFAAQPIAQAGSPISPGGQSIGGAGITQGAPDMSPEQMAAVCNKFNSLTQQQEKLKDALDSDYAEMKWARAYFQKNSAEFEAWNQLVQTMDQFHEAQENFEQAMDAKDAATVLAQPETAVEVAMGKLASMDFNAPLNATEAINGQEAKAGIQSLSGATEKHLKLLAREQSQMKHDALALKGVASQVQAMGSAPCDSTKLVKSSHPQTNAAETTASAAKGSVPASAMKAGSASHARLIAGVLLVGGGAAGAAAYELGKSVKAASSCSFPWSTSSGTAASVTCAESGGANCASFNQLYTDACQCAGYSGADTQAMDSCIGSNSSSCSGQLYCTK